jgi:hypothetical protein
LDDLHPLRRASAFSIDPVLRGSALGVDFKKSKWNERPLSRNHFCAARVFRPPLSGERNFLALKFRDVA